MNYRYVEAELVYLLDNATARGLVYNAEFAPRVAAVGNQLPHVDVLLQVADHTGNPLLPGAVDYESIITTPAPPGGMPMPNPDDVFLLYTGGTTGMPKGVMWRQNDVFVSSMGGRPFGSHEAYPSYDALAERAAESFGKTSVLLIPPLMHGAAQWGAFTMMVVGGWVALPDDVERMQPDQLLRLVERERVMSIPVVGNAIARPLIDEIEAGDYDLSSLVSISDGGAALTPSILERFMAALPNLLIIDTAGAWAKAVAIESLSTTNKTSV